MQQRSLLAGRLRSAITPTRGKIGIRTRGKSVRVGLVQVTDTGYFPVGPVIYPRKHMLDLDLRTFQTWNQQTSSVALWSLEKVLIAANRCSLIGILTGNGHYTKASFSVVGVNRTQYSHLHQRHTRHCFNMTLGYRLSIYQPYLSTYGTVAQTMTSLRTQKLT